MWQSAASCSACSLVIKQHPLLCESTSPPPPHRAAPSLKLVQVKTALQAKTATKNSNRVSKHQDFTTHRAAPSLSAGRGSPASGTGRTWGRQFGVFKCWCVGGGLQHCQQRSGTRQCRKCNSREAAPAARSRLTSGPSSRRAHQSQRRALRARLRRRRGTPCSSAVGDGSAL